MHSRTLPSLLFAVLLASPLACAAHKAAVVDHRQVALEKARQLPSALPGLSVEKAVEQVLADMKASRIKVVPGKWYCNRAIEHEKAEVYKVGFEFIQAGRPTRFGWLYRYDNNKLEPITDYARQVTP